VLTVDVDTVSSKIACMVIVSFKLFELKTAPELWGEVMRSNSGAFVTPIVMACCASFPNLSAAVIV